MVARGVEENVEIASPDKAAADNAVKSGPKPIIQDNLVDISNGSSSELDLFKRQDEACQVIPFCECARLIEVPCLQMGIMTTSGFFHRVQVDIWENGVAVCGIAIECDLGDIDSCSSGTLRCDSGRRAEFLQNRVTYWNNDLEIGPITLYLDRFIAGELILCSTGLCLLDEYWGEQWCTNLSRSAHRAERDALIESAGHREPSEECHPFR
ncbi:hypothetical protein B0I35DRAFT_440364 [Stachybotrys elegans]|uniref:Uncharacterized protein n=1 Tax=Stachybotrys elegans TaxID=80388 RepID=A0A8K0WLT8_9HYPO|nr:hypothetical protein B0I35DRAFT_440364 [Stachybotrys elegans]